MVNALCGCFLVCHHIALWINFCGYAPRRLEYFWHINLWVLPSRWSCTHVSVIICCITICLTADSGALKALQCKELYISCIVLLHLNVVWSCILIPVHNFQRTLWIIIILSNTRARVCYCFYFLWLVSAVKPSVAQRTCCIFQFHPILLQVLCTFCCCAWLSIKDTRLKYSHLLCHNWMSSSWRKMSRRWSCTLKQAQVGDHRMSRDGPGKWQLLARGAR